MFTLTFTTLPRHAVKLLRFYDEIRVESMQKDI